VCVCVCVCVLPAHTCYMQADESGMHQGLNVERNKPTAVQSNSTVLLVTNSCSCTVLTSTSEHMPCGCCTAAEMSVVM
jgi:hypothetical protein